MSDGEMAWTSLKKVTRMFDLHRTHLWQEKQQHPTQKPIKLYEWVLKNYAEPNQKIIDTHLGSGSIAIAIDAMNKIEKMNLTLTACELDKDYFKNTTERIIEQTKWNSLFQRMSGRPFFYFIVGN